MSATALSRYVARNPEILSGEPIIKGTRTSVRAIVGLWRLGIMPEEILHHLPHLTLAQVFDPTSISPTDEVRLKSGSNHSGIRKGKRID